MANTSISNLAAGAAVSATDLLPNVQTAGVGPVKTTAAQIKTFTSDTPTFTGTATFNGALVPSSSFLRNRIINGTFGIDQRNDGVAQTITAGAALAYTVDRWYAYCTGANVTGQRQAGVNGSQYNYRFVGATGNTLIGFGTRIEQLNCFDLASGDVTISVSMRCSASPTITWYLYNANSVNSFGTIASPTVTQIATGTFSVTGTMTRFSATIAAATMAGNTNGLELRFVLSSGLAAAATWSIEDCQIEVGAAATPIERRLFSAEQSLCQRYYTTFGGNRYPGAANSTTSVNFPIPVCTPMRTTPSLTATVSQIYNYAASNVSVASATYSLNGVYNNNYGLDVGGLTVTDNAVYWTTITSGTLSAEL